MLALAQINYIKFLRDVEGMDINAIAKKIKANWRTVKKYADREDWNEPQQTREKTYPVLGPYLDIIDIWLMEDQRRPKKQRHTNIQVYNRLHDECGFKGGVRTVTGYVAQRKKALKKASDKETFIQLNHPGGEAQVDFGTAEVVHQQRMIQIKYLVMSFPYSNAAYIVVLPAENIECFLYGLRTLFEWAGGVPTKLWFDNLSAAVISIQKKGQRQLTEAFQRFQLHYRFQAAFCNPAKGHEKGNVENKVGTVRRNWFVPIPEMTSWEQLNEVMKGKAEAYMKENHYDKKQPIQALWQEEGQNLLFLPHEPFEVVTLKGATLDKYGRFRWDRHFYTVPQGYAHDDVIIKIYWDRLVALRSDYQPMGEFPRPYTFKERGIEWQNELKGAAKKPKALEYTWVYGLLPKTIQVFLNQTEMAMRRSRIYQVIQWLKDGYSMDQISRAVEETSVELWDQDGNIYQSLYRQAHPAFSFDTVSEGYTPEVLKGYDPDLEAYDQLVTNRGVIE